MGKKVIDKRAESIILQEITRQENLAQWYKSMDKDLSNSAFKKIEELKEQLLKIRNPEL